MKIKIPDEIEYILKKLNENGFEAYIVGGCVRDAIMNRKINDFDITTNALPSDLHRIFDKCIDTGLKHGTVTVVVNHTHAEVTTFRVDGEYKNHRSPESVKFSASLSDDLKRRDFTINAMAYNGIVTDLFDGIGDIENKIIRTVNNTHDRFNEDALRMLRAVRFSCTLGFKLHDDIKKAIRDLSHLINFVSCERIKSEFDKIVMSDNVENITEVQELSFFKHILPPLDTAGKKMLKIISNAKKDLCVRYSLLFIVTDIKYAKEFITKYKLSNKEKKEILTIIDFATKDIATDKKEIKKTLSKIGNTLFKKVLCVKDALGEDVSSISDIYSEAKNEPYLTRDLKINGKDLIKIGITGAKIRDVLNHLTQKVIENPSLNDREKLINETDLYFKK